MANDITERIAGELGIRELQGRYIDAVWRKDFTAFADCFTEDGEWRIAGQVLRGRAQCVGILESFIDHYDRVRMVMQPPLLQITGTTAIARTEVMEHNFLKTGGRHLAIGTYFDRLVLHDGCWRYAWHFYQLYYLGSPDMTGAFYPLKDFGPPFAMPGLDEPTVGI
jgi:uncharacterized protein (TIGR02246 family)